MTDIKFARRRFLRQSAAALAGGSYFLAGRGGIYVALAVDRAKTAAELIAGKDPRLIIHGAEPVELETPLTLLAENAITPKSLLFVRNNQSLAGADTTEATAADEWAIEIAGLVDLPATISVKDLAQMKQVEHEIVLQCSGNGRASFSKVAPAKGAQWQCGAMGNVRFRGVPLANVFDRLKLKLDPRARFIAAEGKDAPVKPGEADFEHSIPLDDALARSILALSMNGEPIPAVHGGPVRLVTPGYYATMNVKWLSRLRLEEHETSNYHQVGRYRTPKEPIPPGSDFAYDLANSDANWRMRTKSVIFAPLDGARVSAGKVEVRGVAWNDGSVRIETVLVSGGSGAPWQRAKIEAVGDELFPHPRPLSRDGRGGQKYAWQHWTASLDLPPGEHKIAARAIDELGRSQPLTAAMHWNPAGYACSTVHVVTVVAS